MSRWSADRWAGGSSWQPTGPVRPRYQDLPQEGHGRLCRRPAPVAQHRSCPRAERRDVRADLDDLVAAEEQDEPGAVEPIPGRPLVAAEQIGRAPAEVERRVQPSTFDQLTRIALDLRPAVQRHALRTISREDGPDTVHDLGREILASTTEPERHRSPAQLWPGGPRSQPCTAAAAPAARPAAARAPTAAACLLRARRCRRLRQLRSRSMASAPRISSSPMTVGRTVRSWGTCFMDVPRHVPR